jgi:thioredoxin reductase
VDRITHSGRGYQVDLTTGETVDARRVVVAVGITHFARMPETFSHVHQTASPIPVPIEISRSLPAET